MKKRTNKLISAVLVLAFLLSAFSVLAFAGTGSSAEGIMPATDEGIELLMNRPFDEGWSYSNGFETNRVGAHKYTIEYEEDDDYNYNYFCRLDSATAANGYLELAYGENYPEYTSTVFEMDLKTDDLCNFGSPIIYITSPDAEEKKVYDQFPVAGISNNNLVLNTFGEEITKNSKLSYNAGNLNGQWVHFAISMHVDQRRCPECQMIHSLTIENANRFECTCTVDPNDPNTFPVPVNQMDKVMSARIYFSYSDKFNAMSAVKAPGRSDKIDLNNTYYYDVTFKGIASINSIFVGIPANAKTVGHTYCIDNVKLYNNASVPTAIPAYLGYGLNVDATQAKTEEIIGSALGKTAVQYINEGLVMKVGFDYCVDAGERRKILADKNGKAYGAPVKIDGEVYVPLQAILDWIGYPMFQHDDGLSFDISTDKGSTFIAIGRESATVNGKLVKLKTAPGVVTDAETGSSYVVISKDDVSNIFSGYNTTYDDMGLLIVSEGENLFNRESDLTLMLDIMKGLLFPAISSQNLYNLVKENTNNFAHPYIIADNEQFNALREAYASTEDAELKAYLETVMADALDAFNNYTAIPQAATPVADTPFKLALFQKALDKTLYFSGENKSGALMATDKSSEAVDVYLENVYGEDNTEVIGYRLYFYNGERKTYIRLYEYRQGDAGTGASRIEFVTGAPKEYYTYHAGAQTLVVVSEDQNNVYYMGAHAKTDHFVGCNISLITGNYAYALNTTEFTARFVTLITSNDDAFSDAAASGASGKNSAYEYLFDTVKNPYANLGNNGYDGGGRNPLLVKVTEDMRLLAFAYQINGEEKYATLAYELFTSLALFTHWAPAYFIDCAEATANVAITYDWLYNAWTSLGYDVSEVESVIYKNGLLVGYNYTAGIALNESLLSNQGITEIYNASTNSWNVLGTSNIAIAALALLGTDYLNNGNVFVENPKEGEEIKNTTELDYVKTALTLITGNYATLTQLGLDMYAPDGAFIESPTKWGDATSALMLLSWALNNAAGSDFALSNTWALDKTFYYAYHIEYKTTDGYKYWNYHESIGDYIDNSLAYYAASVIGDNGIAAIRAEQIGFKPVTLWDVFAYDKDYVSAEIDGNKLTLDYTITGCEGVISRSDWSEKALYIGVMGNANNAPGGQLDSGNFIYANNGVTWFGDLGAETHTVYGYSDIAYRYGYYRETAEGANTVIITTRSSAQSMPFGQATNGKGFISDYYSSEYGMYTIINNASVYPDKVTSARRGVLLTNDRKTVVIQDEVVFKDTEECAWVAQLAVEDARVSTDGKSVMLTYRGENGEYTMLRATLIDPTGFLKFQIMSAYDNILSTVYKKEDSQKGGEMYTAELDRSSLKKLVITQGIQSALNIAVVLEPVSSSAPVEYEYKALDDWKPSMITDKFVAEEIKTDVFETPSPSSVIKNATVAESYIKSGEAFYSSSVEDFFCSLARIYNCEFYIGVESGIYLDSEAKKAYDFQYLDYKERYEKFQKEVNSYINDTKKIGAHISGYEK